MTASGCHKNRVSKRSSALSCLLLKTLQKASRSFDGLRLSSLRHKERSRMAKGMSPLRSFMRNPPRKTVPDSVDGGSSGVEATSVASQSRQPLGPITITETTGNPHIPSGEPSTPRAKSKISSQGQEKFPHLENSGRHAASVNVTPDKTANLPSKVKFPWQHRHGAAAQSTTREGPPDLSTPPPPPKVSASSDGQAAALSANNRDTPQTLRGCSTGGGSVQSTPKGGRSVGNKTANELDGGSQSQNSTPCKSVSRSLKYSQQGCSNNSGASGSTNVRSAASQHVITRPMGYLQAVKGGAPQTMNQNFVEQHFEVEEDASFWCDHNVQVIIRTRPVNNSELAAQGPNRCLKQESPHTVSWLGQPESRFTFDHIAGETVTQAKLFDVAGLPMVENCMSGYNSCMFAYGQTGSGKTHTMLGDIEHLDRSPSENRGMTPRVFEYLFGRIRKEQECRRQEHLKFFCKCSFLEIYNEQITDLLEPSSTNLQMREDAKKGVYVENLSEVEVQCVQDVIQLLLQGAANRKVAATNLNRESSRSHSVFTCVVESKWENNSMTNSRYGRLHLVDLAGSERQKSSGAEGGRLKEAANINKSLSTLGKAEVINQSASVNVGRSMRRLVIMILVDVANGKQRHVPYRDSKLTFLLQDSLGGNSKTIMIANVSPSTCCGTETLSTLKFAQRAKFIRNNAVINEDASGDVIALRHRIEELKGEVDRLRRESVLRISSSRVLALQNSSTGGQASGDTLNAPTVDCSATEGFASDSIYANNAQTISIANNDQHLRSMEAVLAGALRREEQAEDITKKLAAEIEQLNRLVRQREEDSQCSKMMLRFREEKIRRLEGIADDVISAESFFADERKNLIDELQLIRARLDRNPELTRFAMENMRLMEELRRYQEFYEGGERDVLIEEISGLRSQLLDKLVIKLGEEQTIGKLSTPQKHALAPELSTLERENELLLIEVKNYQNELKECRNNLNSCLVANADLARQVDKLQATVKELQSEHYKRHEDQAAIPSLDPQESASSANPTSAPIPLETEPLAPRQRQALTNVEGQVSELKKQLLEAQDLIWQLSTEVARSKMTSEEADLDGKHISDGGTVNANVGCLAEDDAIVRQGIQDRREKLQEIEMRHTEEITRLQMELDMMEDVVKEERHQQSIAEQKNADLSSQLSAAVSKLQQGKFLMEDRLKDEQQQRLLAEHKCEELNNQLSAAVSQLDQGEYLAEDRLEGEREQRFAAELKCEELNGQLSVAVSELEQAESLAEDRLRDEREQRLVAEQKCEELSSQLSAAVSQLDQGRALAENDLKEEKEQRLVAEQRSEELSSQLSAAVSQLEQRKCLMEDRLKGQREQSLLAEHKCEKLSIQLSAAVSQLEKAESLAEDRLKGEREQRLVAEQKCEELNGQLSAAVSQLEKAESLAEDRLKGEREQRLVAEQKCEELSGQLSAAISKREQGRALAEDGLKEEKQQRLVAERRCEELSSQLSAAVSQREQGKFLTEDRLEDEQQQRLLAEHECEELHGQLSVAVSQLEEGESLAEDTLKGEREQRLIAEQKCEELNGQLSAAVSQLEQGECPAEDRLKGEREQRFVADQQCEELKGQLSAAVSELRQAQCLVEALEGQQLFSINELEDLQSEHTKLLNKMKQKEEDEGELHRQFQDESSLDDPAVSILEQKLRRARMEKEEARRMNRRFQEEKASRMALEQEREATMSEVETQAALAITTLQSEILELREEVSLAIESDATAKLRIACLHKEVETLQQTTGRLEDNNRLLSNTSDRYRNQVDEKNAQLRALEAQCESVTSKLNDYLADGDKTLTEATKVMDEINQGKVREVSQTDNHNIVRNDDGAVAVYHHLRDVQLMVRKAEGQVRALGDAAAATPGEATGLKFEEGEALIRESEKRSIVAFLMVRELLERIKDLKSAQHTLVEENQQACSRDVAKDLESAALQQQLEEVRRQFGELNDEHQLVVRKHDDAREEYDRSSMQLGTAKELQAKNIWMKEEIQESRRALAEKDEENGNLRKELDEIQTQSTVTADRYQLLMATHDNLEQERARHLEDQALKAAEGEHLIRLSEKKAMAVLVIVEKLLGSKNELKAATMGLTKEIQDERVLLAEKQAAFAALQQQLEDTNHHKEQLATLQQQLEEDTHHHKEIADQYHLLVETHGNLQQEHEILLAEKTLRVKEGEAMVRFSERKALAAFVVLEKLLEKMAELKVTNSSQAKQIQDAHLALTERDSVLASLQNELSEYSDVARRHHVLTDAHDNLRQDNERLVHENVLTAEVGERAIKLSERKATAALVAISQIVDGNTELKAKAERLERGIEEAHAELAKNTLELVAVQQKLEQRDDEAMEVADQQHVLMATHDAFREEHDRLQEELNKAREGHEGLQEELAKRREAHENLQAELEKVREEHGFLQAELEKARAEHVSLQAATEEAQDKQETFLRDNALSVEGRERIVKLSEKKAMGSLVMAEHLIEALKVLKVTHIELGKEIAESHSAHLEKDARLAVVQHQLEESHRYHKEACDGHQVLVGKYENLKKEYDTCLGENGHLQQKVEILELDLKAYHSQVRVLQEISVAAEQQCSEVCTEALIASSVDDMKIADAIAIMTSVRDGLDGMWDDLSLVEEVAVGLLSSLERELSTCLSKVLMLEEENGGNRSARGSLQKEISWLATSLQFKERDLELLRERETLRSKSWEEERGALVSEKEVSRLDCLDKEGMVQSLLLDVQTLDSTLKNRELRVSNILTDVQVLTEAKAELELEKSRLVHAAHQAEANCSKKELEIFAIRADMAAVQARLSAAELREQSISSQMEQLTSASVAWEIERAVVEHEMQQIREGKSKLELHLNDLKLDTGKRELALLETVRRSEEAVERVEAKITAMDQDLGGLEASKANLEHDMKFLGSAATGYVLALEEEVECLELKRQLGIAEVQITQMQSALDLATAQISIEKSNREADNRRMEEERRACETQLRDEIAFAKSLLLSTEGALQSEVQRLESSLKQAEFRVSEMLTAVTALTVAKEALELERSRLVQASSQAEMNCREKEQELIALQGDLAGVLASVAEAELREKSISGQLEELDGAKVEWEVDRAVVKREIEEMRKEKDQLRFEQSYLNAEVEERETAVFESFRRSQEAFEIVETRLTAMDEELGGLGAAEENLEHSIAFLDSALANGMVAFEEHEHKCLEMQRRVQNAEVQMSEMQTATDLAVSQFMLDRENWDVEKRRVKLEKDARETELRDEIAAAQLKLVATERSLKTAVEIVEALGFRKIAEEEEVRKLHEDAKTSLLKVAEQQQEIDTLREMSIVFKAECKEADDSIAALNQLREQYILAEANWRSEQELLRRKVEELEISAGLQNGEGSGKESSGDSTDGGEFSQFLSVCIARSEDQKPLEEFQQLQRQQQDNQVLRTIISENERTILSAKKELHIAVSNCKETEVEMDRVHLENRKWIQIDLENKRLIDTLSVKLRTAEEELLKQDRKIEGYAAEFLKVAEIMSDWETKMQDAEIEWRRDKKALAQELTEAKLVANEKRAEAASILQKFQDGQATLKEAEYLMDALVKANDNAKHDALDWKTERETLGIVEGWWMPERDKLVSEIGKLETDMHTQKQDIWIICKETVIGLVETMDVLSVVEQELYELKNDHQQEMEHLAKEMKVLKDDLVSWLQFPRDLQLEQSPRSTHSEAKLKTMGRMPEQSESTHCDRKEALKMTLLELEHSRSELGSVQVTVCHLQAELTDQSKALRDYHAKLRSVDEVNGELLEKYNHGVMQWENEREERLKQDSLGIQLEETRGAKAESLSENGRLQSCLKAAEHSYATCSSELLALTRAISAGDVIFEQLQMGLKRLVVDIEEVKDQTLVVLVDELRGDHEEMRNITCQMFALRDEVVEVGNLFTAIVDAGQKQLAALTEERQSNQFVPLHQQELEFTRAILTGSLALCETLVSQFQDISVELEDLTSMQGVGTMNLKFRSDFGAMKMEILNLKKTAEEEFRVWTLCRNVTGQDNEKVVATVQDLQSRMKLEIVNCQKIAEEEFRVWTVRKDITGQENERLMATVKDLLSKNSVLNCELDMRMRSIDILEEELVLKEQKIARSLQMVNSQLKAVEKERDRYQTDLVVLNEQLDMAQSLADERDLVAAEAHQAAELSKSHAEEKVEEARILERSVEELESTVYALETQLGIVRRESERQRVEREALEKDLEALKHQMGLMQLTINSQEAQTVRGLQEAEASKTELDRMVIEIKNQQIQARKSVESLQQECAEKDVQLRSCKAYIADLVLGAEKQASENQQKLKALQAMVEHLKVEDRKSNPSGGFVGKAGEKSTGKVKGSSSPFKCIGSGLEKQRSSEMDEELSAAKKRIKELEAVSASRQKEVFMLNTKLAEAESMTHDVIRDLLGVKVDIASYASLLNQQEVQRIAERARRRTAEAQQKEEELDRLRARLNEFIEERESWLEEINRRQADAVAARVSAEKLRLRDQTLTTENETFREDCLVLRKKVTELEDEIEKLSGQQNLQQRIHHHAKIKEENNSIKLQNEDLSGKLRRMEILFTRVNDELARYRIAEGKSAFLNFDEEARLQKNLQETEGKRLQLAEILIGMCTGIMQAAGIQRTSRDLDPSAAMTVLQQLQDRQESLERELSDCKLKARIAVEKRRLSDLRDFHSPVKTISTNTNFTASQQLPSPVSSSR